VYRKRERERVTEIRERVTKERYIVTREMRMMDSFYTKKKKKKKKFLRVGVRRTLDTKRAAYKIFVSHVHTSWSRFVAKMTPVQKRLQSLIFIF